MSDKNTGGPAFPCLEPTVTGIDSDGVERIDTEAHGGMTLRDYFAAKAMRVASDVVPSGIDYEKRLANYSYYIADFMLKAREA